MLSECKFPVQMNVIFNLFLFQKETKNLNQFVPRYSTGISLFKNSNQTSVRYSCKSSWAIFERNRFLITHFWLSTSEPRSRQERLGCLLKLLTLQTQNTSFRQTIMAYSGRKIMFLITVIFIDRLHRIKETCWKWAMFTSRRQCNIALKRGWTYLYLYIIICTHTHPHIQGNTFGHRSPIADSNTHYN